MTGKPARAAAVVAAMAVAVTLPGCARIRGHQGYVMDTALLAAVQPGVDNRESVQRMLGNPSLQGEFDPSTWYYVSRTTDQFSFGLPRPVRQTTVAVHFDKAGTVDRVDRSGLDRVVSINPVGDKTPTLGRKRGLFQELFGNIGAVGSTGLNAPTADNPNSRSTP
ncbi:outer membrane protein assembly factor BamE [Sphingomonas morindae]|uniref:Outer membrane protein assembly factor BamE n=1 Tax=Sphingomonas morindae TaxID=1541170 RepID=A0ABY4X9H6_9SPHN|nr:outer membrane protein assembly factor BamE [Sphingomonas morindae]USI73371.1 outer membrane protein assembly factor BamE [Sphingomonas morindae]